MPDENYISNRDIYGALISLRGDVGRLEGKFDGHVRALEALATEDDKQKEAIQKIELVQARQKGFVAAVSTAGAIIGAGLGAVADYFSRRN